MVENYGNSELARRFGIKRYPAIFVDDILIAKPKDFGFYGKGEGSGDGRYTPWKNANSHERFRSDLKRMIDLVLAGNKESLRKETGAKESDAKTELSTLPSFSIPELSGRALTSKDLSGRTVLVEFWATWCPPCRGTLVWLGKLKQRYGDRLEIVTVAVESDEGDVRELVKDLNLPLRWTIGSPELARSFGDVSSVPTLYLFDSKGRTVEIFYGAPPDLHQNAERAIKSLASSPLK